MGVLRSGLLVLLVIDAVWLLDSLLLKRLIGSPAPVFLASFAALVLVLALRALARSAPASDRFTRFWARLDRSDLLLLTAFLVLFCVQHTEHARASADGRAYFLQVRSLLIDHDVDFTEEVATFGVALAGADIDNPGGVTSYALGAPLAWVPFYAATHYWLGVHNLFGADFARNGFFNAYQRGVGFGSLVYVFLGLLLLRRLLRRYFDAPVVDAGLLLTLFGTFLAWYAAVDATWSHGLSMFSVSAFVVSYELTRDHRLSTAAATTSTARWRPWLLLGFVGGFMMMVRWQNILFFVLPAADLGLLAWRAGQNTDRWRRGLVDAAATAMGALVGFFPQMLFWRLAREGWLDLPSGEHPVYWDAPYWLDTLFSLDRGLVTWTPLAGLALVGLAFVPKGARRLACLLLVAVGLQVYINGTVWWGGHGFGARRFANCIPALALGMTAAVGLLRRRPVLSTALLLAPVLLLNLAFMREVTRSGLGQEGTVTFDRTVRTATQRIGHPFALPAALWFAYRFETDLGFYQRMGSRRYNNVRIDVGEGNDETFLAGGWSDRERAGAYSYRWSSGTRSYVVFRTFEQANYVLHFTAQPFGYPGAPQQVMGVYVNGTEIWRQPLDKSLRDYEIELPKDLMRVHLNAVSFSYSYSMTPRDAGVGPDDRELAVQFGRIELIRAPS